MSPSVPNHPVISSADVVRPTRVDVSLPRLRGNFRAIKKKVGSAAIMPVLKANAYGHGLVEVARLMESLGADYLGVAVLEEGILLRETGITMPILVLGGILGNQIPHFLEYDLSITASSVDKLLQINDAAAARKKKATVHLKFDTGMERIGVHYYNAEPMIKASGSCDHVIVEGVYSHFANSDESDLAHARLQLERFQRILETFTRLGIPQPPLQHIANSGAVLQMPESYCTMVRPGIILYGVYPSPHVTRTVAVKPALTWKSRVVYFKHITPGHPVGYGSTWETDHTVHAVTVPVGYGDGYFRTMSHKAEVIIGTTRYPVIGTISMDQIVVNLESGSAYNGDEVVLIGESGSERISCEELARWAGTIPYEILTNINTRVPRQYHE
ncbi:alanine racemase [bacterium]|nr:alanine racemase [bacterium]